MVSVAFERYKPKRLFDYSVVGNVSSPPRDPCNPPLPNVRCATQSPGAHGAHDFCKRNPQLCSASPSIARSGFKKGGRVKKTGKAMLHKGEFVLPVGVKPTKAQIKKVAMRKKRK
jgi:hypothetical protein